MSENHEETDIGTKSVFGGNNQGQRRKARRQHRVSRKNKLAELGKLTEKITDKQKPVPIGSPQPGQVKI